MKIPDAFLYKNLIKAKTPYAEKMQFLSNRIFGEVARPTTSKSMKVVKIHSKEPYWKQEIMVQYYPRYTEMGYLIHYLRDYGLFRDEHLDFKEEMTRLRALRGKVKRPYGSGQKKVKSLLETKS